MHLFLRVRAIQSFSWNYQDRTADTRWDNGVRWRSKWHSVEWWYKKYASGTCRFKHPELLLWWRGKWVKLCGTSIILFFSRTIDWKTRLTSQKLAVLTYLLTSAQLPQILLPAVRGSLPLKMEWFWEPQWLSCSSSLYWLPHLDDINTAWNYTVLVLCNAS